MKATLVAPKKGDLNARKTVSRIWTHYDPDGHEYDQVIKACSSSTTLTWPFEVSTKHKQELGAVADIEIVETDKVDMAIAENQKAPASQIADAIQKLAENTGIDRETLKKIISEHTRDMNAMADEVEKRVNKRIAELTMPTKIEIVDPETQEITFEGLAHKTFPLLIKAASARNGKGNRLNFWITGPAGTGKTTAGEMLANALFPDGLNEKGEPAFMAQGTSDQKYDLTGFRDASGDVKVTEFRRVYRDGGVILIDEVDGWFPNALLAINSATANDFAIFPDGIVRRHQNTVVLCAANTFGYGEVTEYVGRMKQDAAFLDRFVFLDWPIDEDLEMALAGKHREWCEYVQAVRKRVAKNGYKVLVTPRATMFGGSLLDAGLDQHTVSRMTLKKGMTPDMWDAVK